MGATNLMGKALGIVTRCIVTDLIHRAGFAHNTARSSLFALPINVNVMY